MNPPQTEFFAQEIEKERECVASAEAMGRWFVRHLGEVVARIGVAQVAYHLGVDQATISHAFDGRKRYAIHAWWIPKILQLARQQPCPPLDYLATVCGQELHEAKPLSAEEEARAAREVHAEMGEDFAEMMKARIRERARRNRG